MKLIDKDALLAEIDKQKIGYNTDGNHSVEYDITKKILNIINTLEVPEVNLEKELDEWMRYGPHTNYPWCTIPDAIKITAEHFYELGLKAQKGE